MLSENTLTDFDLQMPDDLLLSEIEKQLTFTEPVYTFTKNFLDLFYTRQMIKNQQRESEDNDVDSDAIATNQADTDNCYRNVILNLKAHCGILIDSGTGEYDPQTINAIYSMFIFRLHLNMIDFIVSSININKQLFCRQFEDISSNNLSMRSARKTFKNKLDAIIAVKYSDIIDTILQDDNMLNPENILQILYKMNPDDYEYRIIANLYNIVYLSFDVPAFCQFIRNAYTDAMSLENLKQNVIERLVVSFPRKTGAEEDNE
jgi:hypothetical protein